MQNIISSCTATGLLFWNELIGVFFLNCNNNDCIYIYYSLVLIVIEIGKKKKVQNIVVPSRKEHIIIAF